MTSVKQGGVSKSLHPIFHPQQPIDDDCYGDDEKIDHEQLQAVDHDALDARRGKGGHPPDKKSL